MHPTYLLVLFALLSGCSEKAHPQPIRVKPGEVFEIKLKAQIATGYRWHLSDSLDTRYLELLDTKYQETNDRDGGVGMEIWRFKAKASGNTRVKLLYNPAWQAESSADSKEQVFEVIID